MAFLRSGITFLPSPDSSATAARFPLKYSPQLVRQIHRAATHNFSPLHHVIGVPSPAISTEEPPPAPTTCTTLSASRRAPRQFFPTVSGSKPSCRTAARLTCLRLSAQSMSTVPQANLPFQFMAGCLAQL